MQGQLQIQQELADIKQFNTEASVILATVFL